MKSFWRLAPSLCLLLACDSGTFPVAPKGAILAIDANPRTISVTGSSAVTVTARDGATGVPLRAGTQIRLSTNLGTIDEVAATDHDGVARATLQADGREGTATVIARSGLGSDGEGPVETSTEVIIAKASEETLKAVFTPVTNDTLTVFFDEDSTGFPTSWEWDFGDGSQRSDVREPTHTYGAAGMFVVALTVRDAVTQDTASQVVTVPQATRPEAAFEEKVEGLEVTFADTSKNRPTSWTWEFGDGATSRLQDPTHTYVAPGSYSVRLTASNAAGSDSTTKIVQVAGPLAADFSFSVNGLTVLFSDRSRGDPTGWKWEFGDSTMSTIGNPGHTYAAAGTYPVTLEVTRRDGSEMEKDSLTKTVTVP